jgi:hypothetical protein
MKETGLRIGNIIDINGIAEVRGVTRGGVWVRNEAFAISAWNGIRITSEVLQKYGFVRKPYKGAEWREYYLIEIEGVCYGFVLGKYNVNNPNVGILTIHIPFEKSISFPTIKNPSKVMDWPEENHHFAWSIAYFHHLQNLILDLTGKELEEIL